MQSGTIKKALLVVGDTSSKTSSKTDKSTYPLFGDAGTATALENAGIPVERLFKLTEGRPNVLDMLKNGNIQLIINTPAGPVARQDEVRIRTTALYQRVPVMTTLAAAQATLRALQSLKSKPLGVKSLQEYHAGK